MSKPVQQCLKCRKWFYTDELKVFDKNWDGSKYLICESCLDKFNEENNEAP